MMMGRFRYAIEVRDSTWFQDLAYNFFADNNIYMGIEPTCRAKHTCNIYY
jgi:hypothetical protein